MIFVIQSDRNSYKCESKSQNGRNLDLIKKVKSALFATITLLYEGIENLLQL